MPGAGEAVSAKQRAAMAIAEHEPDKLYPRNKSMLKMTPTQQHNFAATKGLGAPKGSKTSSGLTRPRNQKSGLIPSNRPKLGGL